MGYNRPEAHKHRKRVRENLSRTELYTHVLALRDKLQASWFKKESYKELKEAVTGLMSSIHSYICIIFWGIGDKDTGMHVVCMFIATYT